MHFTLATSIVAFAALATASSMHQPAEKGAGISIPITKRSNLANANKIVDIDALRSHVAYIKAKYLRGLEIYEQNTRKAHPSEAKGVQKRGQVDTLTDVGNNQLWMGTISVGTPRRSFTIDFDTGSSDLFVPGPSCGSSCDGHNLWDPSSSSSSENLHKKFLLMYGDGSNVTGDLYHDTVFLAGFEATTQTLGSARNYSNGFEKAQFVPDGLMGMAFQSLSAFNASPVFHTLVAQQQVSVPAFSFKLAQTASELYIGGSNQDLYKGNFSYTHVTQEGYWMVKMDNVKGGNQTISTNLNAVIDTGTTLVVGDPSDVLKLYKKLGGRAAPDVGEGFYTFECDYFPEISLSFGNKSFPIPSSDLNIGAVSKTSTDCISGIVGLNTGNGARSPWIVGDVFLQSVYTRFDLGDDRHQPSVGFAELA